MIADVCIIPIGIGTSLSTQVAACERIFAECGLTSRLHANGTNLEGEWDAVMGAIRKCHETLHASGVARISTNLRLGTRVDREQSMDDKVRSVEQKLRGQG